MTFKKEEEVKEYRLNVLAGNLYSILETPISIKILEKLNDKELSIIDIKEKNLRYAVKPYDEEELEDLSIIKSVLENGKSRLPDKTYSPTTTEWLKIKLKQ